MAMMMQFLAPSLCANTKESVDGKRELCRNVADSACGSCTMVQYCSKECQKAHWKEHKEQCKSDLMQPKYVPAWARERRTPSFMSPENDAAPVTFGQKQFLWGNMPALDILKMKENEGLMDLGRDFNLLFAASGDCRNAIKTIVGLPEEYTGQCTAVLNDKDFAVVARNVILLLSALHFDPDVSAPIMIHLWYSSLVPTVMMETLQGEILPYIEDVCAKIKDKSAKSLQAKTFKFSHGSLRLVLQKEPWFQLASFFKVPDGLTCEMATTVRRETTQNPQRKDYIDRALYRIPPGQRMGCSKFRAEGILLPFGCSTKDFDTPNPFFQDPKVWPMMDSADPLDGWLQADYMPHATVAKADVYRSLFFFLGDLFLKFSNRLHNKNILFELYNVDATQLPDYVLQDGRAFDRIEVANICDRSYVCPEKTLSTFAPLLRQKAQNSKATLLLLFLNAVNETEMNLGPAYRLGDLRRRMERMNNFTGVDRELVDRLRNKDEALMRDPQMQWRSSLHDMFANFDELFDLFLREVRMDQLAKANGVRMKKQHSLVEKWPYRVTNRTSKEEFALMCTSNLGGWERYVEFERA